MPADDCTDAEFRALQTFIAGGWVNFTDFPRFFKAVHMHDQRQYVHAVAYWHQNTVPYVRSEEALGLEVSLRSLFMLNSFLAAEGAPFRELVEAVLVAQSVRRQDAGG